MKYIAFLIFSFLIFSDTPSKSIYIYYNQYSCLHCYESLLHILKKTKAEERYTIEIITLKTGSKINDAENSSFAASLMQYQYPVREIDKKTADLMLKDGDSITRMVLYQHMPTPAVEIIDNGKSFFFDINRLFVDSSFSPEFLSALNR